MKKIIIFLLLIIASCASTEQYVKYAQPNQNEATIYVIRSGNYGSAVKTKVYQNDKLVGKLGPKSYLSWNVPTGQQITLKARNSGEDFITIKPKAGKTYYIKQDFKNKAFLSKEQLEVVSNEEGIDLLNNLKRPKVQYVE